MEEAGRPVLKRYDIESQDYFWKKNAGNPFPEVAGMIILFRGCRRRDKQVQG